MIWLTGLGGLLARRGLADLCPSPLGLRDLARTARSMPRPPSLASPVPAVPGEVMPPLGDPAAGEPIHPVRPVAELLCDRRPPTVPVAAAPVVHDAVRSCCSTSPTTTRSSSRLDALAASSWALVARAAVRATSGCGGRQGGGKEDGLVVREGV